MFLLALIITIVSNSPLLIWLFRIRPYCRRHGQAYTPGAIWWVTLWIDWQSARELAKQHNDTEIRFSCALFFILHSIWTLLMILTMAI